MRCCRKVWWGQAFVLFIQQKAFETIPFCLFRIWERKWFTKEIFSSCWNFWMNWKLEYTIWKVWWSLWETNEQTETQISWWTKRGNEHSFLLGSFAKYGRNINKNVNITRALSLSKFCCFSPSYYILLL